MTKHSKSKKNILGIGLLAAVSILWLIVRSGRKPSRIAYPCQRAAIANVHIFLLVLFVPLINSRKLRATLRHIQHDYRLTQTILLVSSLLLAFESSRFTGYYSPLESAYFSVPLDLKPQNALTSAGSSDLFFIENASDVNGNMDDAISTLMLLMENHGLFFFKTTTTPSGLIDSYDVVLIKVNAVGSQRSGTNTDLVKSLITRIVNHPEGFAGEIVVADNGQDTGGLDLAENNAYNHSQSMQKVVDTFASFKVSTWSWYTIRSNTVNEYNQGDLDDGYVVNSTENPTTHLRVSYPKFQTKYGTYISFKNGIWNTTTNSYDSAKLKIINVPVLKSHYNYGVTACVKNYMGVASQTLTNSHDQVKYGAMGTEIVDTRFPTLTLLDAVWVNANPIESSGYCGPYTPYEVASFTNVIGASQDPVALEYWASKYVLLPAAIHRGYTSYSSLDPDYSAVTPGLTESYHNYLERSMNELKKASYQATMIESEMNVYVAQAGAEQVGSFSYIVSHYNSTHYSLINGTNFNVDYVSSDASEVINFAIANASIINGIVHVESGIYKLTRSIIPKSYVYVYSPQATFLECNSSLMPPQNLSQTFSMLAHAHQNYPLLNFTLDGGIWDGQRGSLNITTYVDNAAYGGQSNGIYIYSDPPNGGNWTVIKNVIVRHIVRFGVALFRSQHSLVENVTTIDVGHNGITIDAGSSAYDAWNHDAIVRNSYAEFSGDVGINVFYGRGVQFINNKAINNTSTASLYQSNWGFASEFAHNVSFIRNQARNQSTGIGILASEDVALIGNSAENNSAGISIQNSSNLYISACTLKNNSMGVCIHWSNSTGFFHNNIIANSIQARIFNSTSITWDNGYPNGGNYWINYNGIDLYWGSYQNRTGSDGMGDTPYTIDDYNRDNYPLMSPYEYWSNPILGDINKDMEVDNEDLLHLATAYGSTLQSPNWNPNADLNNDKVVNVLDLRILGKNYANTTKP